MSPSAHNPIGLDSPNELLASPTPQNASLVLEMQLDTSGAPGAIGWDASREEGIKKLEEEERQIDEAIVAVDAIARGAGARASADRASSCFTTSRVRWRSKQRQTLTRCPISSVLF